MLWRGVLLLSWSRTQGPISQSSCEAELVAMSTATSEARFLQNILAEVDEPVSLELVSDSLSSLHHTMRRGVGRIKHLELRYLCLQEEVRQNRLRLRHVSSAANAADVLTKAVSRAQLEVHLSTFGLCRGGSEQVVAVICRREVEAPRCCGRPMALILLPSGLVSWQCARNPVHLTHG